MYPGLPTLVMSSSAWYAMASMIDPMISCIGIIHDFLRPIEGKNLESTIGDHRSLRE